MGIRQYLIVTVVTAVIGLGGMRALSAWNSRVTPAKIAAGKILFEHEWQQNDPLSKDGDGLGPVFNAQSCVECHFQGGVGGASGNDLNVTAFEVIDPDEEAPHLTGVVHANAVHQNYLESKENVRELFPIESFITQIVEPERVGGCESVPQPPRVRFIQERNDPVVFHQLNSPSLFGVGLIDKISNVSVTFQGHKRLANRISSEFGGKFGGNRLGLVNLVDGGVGKFGWKGQFHSLEDFVASACAMEIGLTNPMHSQPVAKEHRSNHEAKMDMTRKQLNELVCFVRSLPRPNQVLPTEHEALKRVNRGEEVFTEVGCADCHVRDMGGVEQIYSDFHLYNLEPVVASLGTGGGGYGDGKAEEEFNFESDNPHPDQWQTPALWGVADTAPYFHDGSSPNLKTAILRHHGQADSSRQGFIGLKKHDQKCLIEFLESLRAPVAVELGEASEDVN